MSKATVVYSVVVDTTDIAGFKKMSPDEKKDAIYDLADKIIESSPPSPVIHEADDKELID
jgi:hypothetical protein